MSPSREYPARAASSSRNSEEALRTFNNRLRGDLCPCQASPPKHHPQSVRREKVIGRRCNNSLIQPAEDLENGEEVATCPSCSLIVKVIYDKDLFLSGEVVDAPSSTSESKLELVQT
ncbi:Zinc finger-containing protein 2 [Collichthys lucidus]|uniref:Zinc finger-containing protein 2 n=1 Tax=Collichthys lucidus TaxID=240159 RepID=A0A4U5TYV8_COLLU|nr:Zinc finger-containing protein 2 [Collichthys lucidus]